LFKISSSTFGVGIVVALSMKENQALCSHYHIMVAFHHSMFHFDFKPFKVFKKSLSWLQKGILLMHIWVCQVILRANN
jgi:hypothetical protein